MKTTVEFTATFILEMSEKEAKWLLNTLKENSRAKTAIDIIDSIEGATTRNRINPCMDSEADSADRSVYSADRSVNW